MENKFYKEALKSGQKNKRHLVSQGNYPYLPVLEDMVSKERMNSGTRLGVMDIPTEFLRDNICYITQDNFLFSSSLKENINLFKDNYGDEEIAESFKIGR